MIMMVIAAMDNEVKSFLLLSNMIVDAGPGDCCGRGQPNTLPINVADI
jgi:hypothetical protein